VTHGGEIVGWVAVEWGQGTWNGKKFEVGTTGDKVKEDWFTQNFGVVFGSVPIFTAAMQSYDNTGSTHLRYNNLAKDSVQLAWFRDVGSPSGSSNTEEVGYIAFDTDGELKAISRDCNGIPLAYDKLFHCEEGESLLIQLGNDRTSDGIITKIIDLPTTGILYQFTGKDQLLFQDAIGEANSTVIDTQGRVIFKAFKTFEEDHTDHFSYTYLQNTSNPSSVATSNTAKVTLLISMSVSSPPIMPPNPPPRPPLSPPVLIPTNQPTLPTVIPTDSGTSQTQGSPELAELSRINHTLIGLLAFAFVVVALMALAIIAFGFFLYKKRRHEKR